MRAPARSISILVLVLAACGKKGGDAPVATPSGSGPVAIAPQGKVLEAAENAARDGGTKARAAGLTKPHETATIGAGSFQAGSTPGDTGRDPTLEPAELKVELGGFSIDRYLYPNEPGKPPVVNVTRAKAQELCEGEGGRLCTELEWERACKGPDGAEFGAGASWDAACSKDPTTCASGFGVLGMGAALREWTSSNVAPIENVVTAGAAVRGARGDAGGPDHRCAHRASIDASVSSDDLGFRCCHGAPNAASIPSPKWQETFRKAELTPQAASAMFASVPQLKDLGSDLIYFKEPDDVNLVLQRGDAGAGVPNTQFTTEPLLWSPVPGEEILVVAGRGGKNSFIVAFHRLPGDRYRIASTLLLKDERGPIALGHNNYIRKKLGWGICWDCRGESGNITYREDGRVVITQK